MNHRFFGGEDQFAAVIGVVDTVSDGSAAEYVADAHADDLRARVVASADEGVLHTTFFAAAIHDHVAGGAVDAQVCFIGYTNRGAVVGARPGGEARHLRAVAALVVGTVGTAAPPVGGVGAVFADAAAAAPVTAELATQFVLLGVDAGVDDGDADAGALARVPGSGNIHVGVVPGQFGTGADGGVISGANAAGGSFGTAGAGAEFQFAAAVVAGL